MLTDPHPEEKVPPGEADDIAEITRVSLAILDTRGRPVRRGQHPKQHGCVRAEFHVRDDVPDDLKIGVFAEPRTYPAWVRFSNGSKDDDEKGDVHGMAVKLMGVDGPKVLEEERDAQTQDFVLMDYPAFFSCDAASNRGLGQVMEQALEISPFRRLMFWADLGARRAAYIALWHFIVGGRGRELKVLRAAAGSTPASPLRAKYWSATPYALGGRAVKYIARPVPAPAVPEPTDMHSPDRLRAAMEAHLDKAEARFDFLVQLREPRGNPRMPVEDATTQWPETEDCLHPVATIVIPPQTFNTPEQDAFGENLSFAPWHALPVHRPIGGINRARKVVYEALSRRRHLLNKAPRVEPGPGDQPCRPGAAGG